MKYKILLFSIVSVFIVSCSFRGVRGNGDLVNEVRDTETFDKVSVSGNFDVEIMVGEDENLEIVAESNLMKYIKTKFKKNTLYISSAKNLKPRKELKIHISCPELFAIECSGVNDIYARGISSNEFSIDLSGAGSIEIAGTADILHIDVSGAADLMAKELVTQDVKIDVSGAANAEVYASRSCNAAVSGAGYIELYGDAEDVNMDISGAGSLERR